MQAREINVTETAAFEQVSTEEKRVGMEIRDETRVVERTCAERDRRKRNGVDLVDESLELEREREP